MDTLKNNPQADMTCMRSVEWNHGTGQVHHTQAVTLWMDTLYNNPQLDDMHEFRRVEPCY